MGRVNGRVSGWMKLDEGSRDGAEVKKKKKHKERRKHTVYVQCTVGEQDNMQGKRDLAAFYSQIHL